MRKQDPSVRPPEKYTCTAKSPARFAPLEVIPNGLESGIPSGNPVFKIVHVYFSSNISSDWFCHTSETAVVILLPPDAPIISCTSPVSFTKMAGDMDENGRLPASGELTLDG